MKNLALLFILIIASMDLFAQEPIRKVHFGATINPQMNLSSFGEGQYVEKANSFCYTGSVDILFDLSSRLQLKSGLGIRNVSLKHRDSSARWPSQGMNGEWVPDGSYFGYNTKYFFAGIPVNLKMKFNDKPNHIYISGGLSMNHLLGSSGEIVINESGHIRTSDPDQFLFDINSSFTAASLGIGYEALVGKTKIFIEPNIENSFGNFFKEETGSRANGKIFLLGLKLGAYL